MSEKKNIKAKSFLIGQGLFVMSFSRIREKLKDKVVLVNMATINIARITNAVQVNI